MTPETQKEGREFSESGFDITPISAEEREQLAQDLDDEAYRVLLEHGTEPAFLRKSDRQ